MMYYRGWLKPISVTFLKHLVERNAIYGLTPSPPYAVVLDDIGNTYKRLET